MKVTQCVAVPPFFDSGPKLENSRYDRVSVVQSIYNPSDSEGNAGATLRHQAAELDLSKNNWIGRARLNKVLEEFKTHFI